MMRMQTSSGTDVGSLFLRGKQSSGDVPATSFGYADCVLSTDALSALSQKGMHVGYCILMEALLRYFAACQTAAVPDETTLC